MIVFEERQWTRTVGNYPRVTVDISAAVFKDDVLSVRNMPGLQRKVPLLSSG